MASFAQPTKQEALKAIETLKSFDLRVTSFGQDSCLAKTESEWMLLIAEIMDTDHRSCLQINDLLEQGHVNSCG